MIARVALLLLLTVFPIYSLHIFHMSFHRGCILDFEEVAEQLGLELTSWYIHDATGKPEFFFDGVSKNDNVAVKYNLGHERAERVWLKHKDYFDQFDLIVVSDTAPLSRIFLQNDWKKPLVVWICNRFDYYDAGSLDCHFPDREYYDLIQMAVKLPNVTLVSYTPYEHEYARRKGIEIGNLTIKPIGIKEQKYQSDSFETFIPTYVQQQETLFVFPRLSSTDLATVTHNCSRLGIKAWSGKYNGPRDLQQFKAVLFFPYAFSNLALFENLSYGIVHFVPTKRFLLELGFVWDGSLKNNLDWCEWYFEEYKDYFVFFDSWHDLQLKVATTDYELLQKNIKIAGARHRSEMLGKWSNLFNDLINQKMNK